MTTSPASHRTALRLTGALCLAIVACVLAAGTVPTQPAAARAARTLTISVNKPTAVMSGGTVTLRCRARDQNGKAVSGVQVAFRWRLPEGTRTQARMTGSSGLAAAGRVTDCGSGGDFTARVVVTATWHGQTRSVTRTFTIIGGT
jgi:hypothetical protein